MVKRYYHKFRMSSNEKVKAASRYKFDFCLDCPFYECELVEEYMQFKRNHTRNQKSQFPVTVVNAEDYYAKDGGALIKAVAVSAIDYDNEQDKKSFIRSEFSGSTDTDSLDIDILSYDQSKLKDGCFMNFPHVYQVECGRRNVIEGIGDHYKIEIDDHGKIKENIEDRWEPLQPVFISAQTGQGKNHFIEKTLIPYLRDLNIGETTDYKALILSNRRALKEQIKNRIDVNDEDGKIYSYGNLVDVMTYQSLLHRESFFKSKQSGAQPKYVFVICDEAHFFTSDAMFNPHTHKILQTIVRVFQNAVRIYMSATPDECLEYIIKCEDEEQERLNLKQGEEQYKWKTGTMVFYHFKRDYSYFDVKTYSSINELYGIIVDSVDQRKEKWLIFIDDINKCVSVKNQLEKLIEERECEDDETKEKVEKVYAINADSKKEPIYQEIVKNEKLNADTYVLISTSVLDNGVNLKDIKNIVVYDMAKTKCLQMAGRARVKENSDRKNLYIKRFSDGEVKKRITDLMKQQDAYHSYKLAYDKLYAGDYSEYKFLNKYYNGEKSDWLDAKRWFGRTIEKVTKLYLNEIAKSLMERFIPQYQYILDEMIDEGSKEDDQQKGKNKIGQKYLEYQLAWFGKKYCEDNDITFTDMEKAKKEFIDFLESYAESGKQIEDTTKKGLFRPTFTRLYDAAFGRMERDKRRIYGIDLANKGLRAENINYKVVSHSSYWVVEKCNWEIEDSK